MSAQTTFEPGRIQDAWFVLRGFFAQIDATLVRWLELPTGYELQLEFGEDIDLVKQTFDEAEDEQVRQLEQIKHRVKNLTLRSTEAQKALVNYAAHATNNPGMRIRYVYTSNCGVGREKDLEPGEDPGIVQWQSYQQQLHPSPSRFLAMLRALTEGLPQAGVPVGPWKLLKAMMRDDTSAARLIEGVRWNLRAQEVAAQKLIALGLIRERQPDRSVASLNNIYRRLFLFVFESLAKSGLKVLTSELLDKHLDGDATDEGAEAVFARLDRLDHIAATLELVYAEARDANRNTQLLLTLVTGIDGKLDELIAVNRTDTNPPPEVSRGFRSLYTNKIHRCLDASNLAAANEVISELLEERAHPPSDLAFVYSLQGSVLRWSDDLAGSLEAFQKAIDLSGYPSYRINKAVVLVDLKRLSEAEATIRDALRREDSAKGRSVLAGILENTGRYAEELELLRIEPEGAEEDDLFDYRLHRSMALIKCDRVAHGLDAMRALTTNPSRGDYAKFELAGNLLYHGQTSNDFARVEEALRLATEIDGRLEPSRMISPKISAKLKVRRACIHAGALSLLGRDAEAIDVLTAVDTNPADQELEIMSLVLYMRQGDLESADEILDKLERVPDLNDLRALYQIVLREIRKGLPWDQFQTRLSQFPNGPLLKYTKSLLATYWYEKNGQFDNEVELFKRIIHDGSTPHHGRLNAVSSVLSCLLFQRKHQEALNFAAATDIGLIADQSVFLFATAIHRVFVTTLIPLEDARQLRARFALATRESMRVSSDNALEIYRVKYLLDRALVGPEEALELLETARSNAALYSGEATAVMDDVLKDRVRTWDPPDIVVAL